MPIKARSGKPVVIPENNFDDIPIKSSAIADTETILGDFDNLPVKPRGIVQSQLNEQAMNNHDDVTVQENGISLEGESQDFLACGVPAARKVKGDTDEKPQKAKGVTFNIADTPMNETVNHGFTDEDFDSQFKPPEFMDDLSFLENCVDNDNESAQRQAELARKSLYVRFDPLIKGDSPEKPVQQLNTNSNNTITLPDDPLDITAGQPPEDFISSLTLNNNLSNLDKTDNPFSQNKTTTITSPKDRSVSSSSLNRTSVSSAKDSGLVEPLLYSQSDLDEVVRAREDDWKKKYEELESKIKEEIAMRELLEQDHREKMDSLRRENVDMKQVVAQYEKTIVDLTENSHHSHMFNEETLSETVRAKDQLQQDLHSAEQNLVDAYKRIEKLKHAIDAYKNNEDDLKQSVNEFQIKLKRSEERYQKLKQHAAEKVESANIEINKVRKQKEIDLAGLQAGLKKAQSRINGLEQEVQQKTRENAEMTQICDDLIKQVSGE